MIDLEAKTKLQDPEGTRRQNRDWPGAVWRCPVDE
jgi:hypothetical protein